jgi:transcription elongation factor GreA
VRATETINHSHRNKAGNFFWINMSKVQVTKSGLDTLKKELDQLVNVKRPKVVDRLSNARSQGDLSENSDYHNAKEELEFLDGRIDELQDVVAKAVVVEGTNGAGVVEVGTKVTVKVNGMSLIYDIVGEWEADPMQKKISSTSPLGQALVGKGKGDSVEVEAPVGKVKYEIVSVG